MTDPVAPMTSEERERIRARLRAAMAADPAVTPLPARRPRRVPLAAVAAVLLVVAAIAAVAVAVTNRGGGRDHQIAASEPPLISLATLARRTAPTEPLPAGAYRYLKAHTTTKDPAHPGHVRESWVAADGSGRLRVTPDSVDGTPGQVDDTRYELPDVVPSELGMPEIHTVLGSPDVTMNEYIDRVFPRLPRELFAQDLVTFLAEPAIPAVERSSALRILHEGGFKPIGRRTDPQGRTGAAYQGPSTDGTEVTFILDVDTLQVRWMAVSYRTTTSKPPGTYVDGNALRTTADTTFVTAAVVPTDD